MAFGGLADDQVDACLARLYRLESLSKRASLAENGQQNRLPQTADGGYGVKKQRRHVQPSAGTRTGWEAAKGLFRPPSESAAAADQEAFKRGEDRAVSCSLRGSVDPYPRHSRQGVLELTQRGMVWRPTWGLRRRPIPITEQNKHR
jgi:hypothetical protein